MRLTADHQYAADLDITGHASLARLLDVTSAGPGRRTLMAWLLEAPYRRRRAACDGRRRCASSRPPSSGAKRSRRTPGPRPSRATDVERFLAWAEQQPWLRDRPAMVWAGASAPVYDRADCVCSRSSGMLWSRGVDTATRRRVRFDRGRSRKRGGAIPLVAGVVLTHAERRAGSRSDCSAAMSHLSGLAAYAADARSRRIGSVHCAALGESPEARLANRSRGVPAN